ncbi:MAG TPA: hypothetical protein VEC13_02390 [Candidatus Paceibacterota bacterium]|nr:hypothetical protein [Candidatus Paceibacterota bacterium]
MITKDEKIKTSSPYLGFLVLKKLAKAKEQKLMLDEIVLNLKQELPVINHRQVLFSLIFLYQAGVVEFAEPYIYKK